MGLDQRIWAEIQSEGVTKQVAMYYWRKDYGIDTWFFGRLGMDDQREIEAKNHVGWTCDVTVTELDLLEGNDYSLAFEIGFCLELLTHCRWALGEGFKLTYSRNN